MTADALLYAVRLTEWEVGRCTTMHLRSLAADAEPLYRSPTVGRIAIQRPRLHAVRPLGSIAVVAFVPCWLFFIYNLLTKN